MFCSNIFEKIYVMLGVTFFKIASISLGRKIRYIMFFSLMIVILNIELSNCPHKIHSIGV